jgi:uncharacterized protein (DUF433 family)
VQLEDYFEFNSKPVEHIRIKGTRIDIDFVIDYFKKGMTPEQIAANFVAPLELEQVYATITYYLHNREQVDAYLQRGEAIGEANYRAYLAKGPSELLLKLQAAKANRTAGAGKEAS